MKTNRFILLLLLVSIFTNLAAQVNLNAGLVAYYPFNGNANDESGNNNNATTVKATFIPDRFGKPNSACYFNGKNNYIRIPDDASLHFKKGFSISAWVMVKGFYEGTCHGNRIIMKGSTDYLNGNYMLTFDDNHSTKGGNCYTNDPDKKRQSFYAPNAAPITNDYIVTDKWYSLTYTYDGSNALFYVDCKLQGKGTISNYNFSNNYDLFFGKMDNSQYPYWFNGLLDEVRMYNRALNKDEILALCSNKPIQAPDIPCPKATIVTAKFDFNISNCTTTAFNLQTTATKNIKTIQWFFGDGTTSNKLSPVHTYQKKGTYKVKTIVTNKAGCADTFTRQIQFRELKTDFTFSELGEPGEIQFKTKNNNATYSWNFGDGAAAKNQSVVTHLYNKAGQFVVQMLAQNNDGCRDTAEKRIDIVLPEFITDVSPSNNPVVISPKLPVVQLEKRDKDVIRTIPVENDSISISLYDNGIIDGDSITLIFNNTIIVAHQLLSNKPLTLYLKIDRGKSSNELMMYAENLGSIPPNTALMIINDGNHRHQVNVSSSKSSNGVISFTLKR